MDEVKLVVDKEVRYRMNTLEELTYYCNESQPVGALMLTGQWGCGKTYLLNNILTDTLKDTHIILRVSLFGMESIEEVKGEVKRCWLYALGESKEPISGMADKVKKAGSVMKSVFKKTYEVMPDPVKAILSLNPIDFIKIGSQIGEKRVILIFDDLERDNISTGNLLGCINDYCENLHINTIVVANEEKIKSSEEDKIKYNEIKEKIIQRTIYYSPDYATVVSSIIENMMCGRDDTSQIYKGFLNNNKEVLSAMFSDSIEDMSLNRFDYQKYDESSKDEYYIKEEKTRELFRRRPHNMRSFKCAIQDFKRIYLLLDGKQIDHKEKWLFTYLSYVLSFRAGLISESDRYGTLFSDEKVSVLYPGFYDDKYITDGIKQWVRHGDWNQDLIEDELECILDRDKALTPEEKVCKNKLLDLDESDIQDGYLPFLEKAYVGEIKLNDYINLLYNRCWAREYNIQLPDVEWDKIHKGICKQIKKMIQEGEDQPHNWMIIGEENKEYFLQEEWDAYKIIREFVSGNTLMFEKNKLLYVDLIKKDPVNAFAQTQNKRFDKFDVNMAKATVEGFEKASNADKDSYVDYFDRMWKVNICTQDYNIKLSEEGFEYLKIHILQFLDKCDEKTLYISKIHAKRFLEVINNLIHEQKQKLEELHNVEDEKR